MLTKKSSSKTADKPVKKSKSDTNNAVEKLLKSSLNAKSDAQNPSKTDNVKKIQKKTQISVKCNAGFLNDLYIRGEGAGLNWNKGEKLKNISADEWVWETNQSFSKCEFKILINDKNYENGENHCLHEGACLQCTPNFS